MGLFLLFLFPSVSRLRFLPLPLVAENLQACSYFPSLVGGKEMQYICPLKVLPPQYQNIAWHTITS